MIRSAAPRRPGPARAPAARRRTPRSFRSRARRLVQRRRLALRWRRAHERSAALDADAWPARRAGLSACGRRRGAGWIRGMPTVARVGSACRTAATQIRCRARVRGSTPTGGTAASALDVGGRARRRRRAAGLAAVSGSARAGDGGGSRTRLLELVRRGLARRAAGFADCARTAGSWPGAESGRGASGAVGSA